jgi:hypothetical protein
VDFFIEAEEVGFFHSKNKDCVEKYEENCGKI